MGAVLGYKQLLEFVEAALKGKNVDPLTRGLIAYLMSKASVEKRRVHLRLLFYILNKLNLYPCKINLSVEELNVLKKIEIEVKEYFKRNPLKSQITNRKFTIKFSIHMKGTPSLVIISSQHPFPSLDNVREEFNEAGMPHSYVTQTYLI